MGLIDHRYNTTMLPMVPITQMEQMGPVRMMQMMMTMQLQLHVQVHARMDYAVDPTQLVVHLLAGPCEQIPLLEHKDHPRHHPYHQHRS